MKNSNQNKESTMKAVWRNGINENTGKKWARVYIYACTEQDKYPIAEIYFGAHWTATWDLMTIDAISGLLPYRTKRCESCLQEGAHGLARGPVDTIFLEQGRIHGVSRLYFTEEDMRQACVKYFDIDPGELPPYPE
jgi:hypothetical protein